MGMREARRDADGLTAPGTAMPSQQNYETGNGISGDVGVGQQGGRTINDHSQGIGRQDYDDMNKRNVGTGLGNAHTVGALNAGNGSANPFQGGDDSQGIQNTRGGQNDGINASLAMRQDERERGGMGQNRGWDEGSTGGAAPGISQQRYQNQNQATYAQDNAGRGSGFETGAHPGRHVAEAGAMAGLSHHTKRVHRNGGLHNNGEHRPHERDFATNQASTGTGTNTGLAGTYDGHDAVGTYPNQNSVQAGRQPGTVNERAPGAGLGTGTGTSSGFEPAGSNGGAYGTGASYATGQAPGFGPGQGAYENGSGLNGGVGQSTASGTSNIIIGKLEQAAGMLLSDEKMRAKGLEKEAKGEAQRDVSHAEQLEQQATTLRERSAQQSNAMEPRSGMRTGNIRDGTTGECICSTKMDIDEC